MNASSRNIFARSVVSNEFGSKWIKDHSPGNYICASHGGLSNEDGQFYSASRKDWRFIIQYSFVFSLHQAGSESSPRISPDNQPRHKYTLLLIDSNLYSLWSNHIGIRLRFEFTTCLPMPAATPFLNGLSPWLVECNDHSIVHDTVILVGSHESTRSWLRKRVFPNSSATSLRLQTSDANSAIMSSNPTVWSHFAFAIYL